jgi:hypothetical protein
MKDKVICTEDFQECEKCTRTIDNCMIKKFSYFVDKIKILK